jgi:membrane protein required for colicin V production
MMYNALDILIVVILFVTFIIGLIKGFVRGIVGLVAVVAGLLLAARFYIRAGYFFHKFIASAPVSQCVGFLVIFGATLLAGWLIGLLVSMLMKGPLAFVNRILGGALGLLKGILICGVLVLALLAFETGTDAIKKSRMAPYCLKITKAIVRVVPAELKAKFQSAYENIRGGGESHGQKI